VYLKSLSMNFLNFYTVILLEREDYLGLDDFKYKIRIWISSFVRYPL